MSGGIQAYVTDDPERDWPRVAPHIAYAQDSYRRYMVEGTDQPAPRPIDPEKWRETGLSASGVGQFLYGTPQDTAEAIKAYVAGLPVEGVFLWASLAGMPEEMVARQVQLIAGKLRPLLADV